MFGNRLNKLKSLAKKIRKKKKEEIGKQNEEDTMGRDAIRGGGYTSNPDGSPWGAMPRPPPENHPKPDDSSKKHYGLIIGSIILISIIAIVAGFILNNDLVISLLESGGLLSQANDISSKIQYSMEYASCVIGNTNRFSLGSMSSGQINANPFNPIFDYCDEKLGINADEIGCTECFDISIEALNSRVLANREQDAIVRAIISAEENEFCYTNLIGEQACQQLTPAKDPEINIATKENFGESNIVLQGRCKYDNCAELDPNLMPFTIVGRIKDGTNDFCNVDSVNARASLRYTYRAEGSAPITIRARGVEENFFNERNPITLPGPIKVDIIPDAFSGGTTYEKGIDHFAIIFIRFRNQGHGVAEITNLRLSQITPEGSAPLQITQNNCDNIGSFIQDNGEISISIEKGIIELGPKAKSITIACTIPIENVNVIGDFATYILIGEATYNYKLERKASSILVEKSACTKNDLIATTPDQVSTTGVSSSSSSPGSQTTSSSDEGLDQCAILPNENKVCPSGTTFREYGCCE